MTGERTFTITDDPFDVGATRRLQVNLDAPLPLGYTAAIRRALQLRGLHGGFSYTVIAHVLREYHGFTRTPGWWAIHLRAAGAEPRPHGVPFNGNYAKRERTAA